MSKCLFLFSSMLLVFCSATRLMAQEERAIRVAPYVHNDSTQLYKSVPQKDIFDVIDQVFGKKKALHPHKDSISSKPTVSVVPAIGYTLTSGLAATLSGNIAFKLGPAARVSTITASPAFSLKNQITIPIESSIWLKNGKYVLIGDARFYKYPQSTYGLGSGSHLANENPMDYHYVRFYETVLRKVAGNLFVGGGYNLDYHLNVSQQGLANGKPSAYDLYGTASHSISSGLTVNALFDNRDNSINAAKGAYASLQFRGNYRAMGSTQGWHSMVLDVRKYVHFPAGSDNVLAFWSYNWITLSGKAPYLDLPANGWDSYSTTGRGYIQGRFRRAQMVYLETEYRYKITDNGLLGGVFLSMPKAFRVRPVPACKPYSQPLGRACVLSLTRFLKLTSASIMALGAKVQEAYS